MSAALSERGAIVAPSAYMSPEQAQGQPVDARSDMFSFGAVLYEMLSGRRAFRGRHTASDPLGGYARDAAAAGSARGSRTDRHPVSGQAAARSLPVYGGRRSGFGTGRGEDSQSQHPSIAVLPFANMSRDPDDEYFSDGLAEEIINLLAHVPNLKVTARTSSFAFRGKEQDIRGIAEALGVRTILEGSVRRAGSRIRVTAQIDQRRGRLSPLVRAVRPRTHRRLRDSGRDRPVHRRCLAAEAHLEPFQAHP